MSFIAWIQVLAEGEVVIGLVCSFVGVGAGWALSTIVVNKMRKKTLSQASGKAEEMLSEANPIATVQVRHSADFPSSPTTGSVLIFKPWSRSSARI